MINKPTDKPETGAASKGVRQTAETLHIMIAGNCPQARHSAQESAQENPHKLRTINLTFISTLLGFSPCLANESIRKKTSGILFLRSSAISLASQHFLNRSWI